METHAPFYCLIPGSFRPPHQGHYEMISHYRSLASEAGGKVIVIVSKPSKKNERLTGSGQVITPQFAKEKLHEMFGDSIEVRISEQSPVRDCYEFGSEITEGTVMFGCANKDKDIERFTRETARNIQMEVEPNVIAYIERFESSNNTAYRFSLDRFEGNSMKSHFTARTLVYQGTKENPHQWKARNWQHRIFTDTLEHITSGLQQDTIIRVEPYDLLISKNQQETLTSPELKHYIDKQRRRGIANIKEFELEYHKRIATSFAAFILTLIGVSLSVKKVKGGMGLNLGIGIALSFGYIVFQTISSTFAINGSMLPMVAVWIPNITFLIIGIFLYRRASK